MIEIQASAADHDRTYWEQRAAKLGLRAGGHVDICRYIYEGELRRKAFRRLVSVHSGMHVLDVGAGVGNWCFWFEECGAHVVGIDISQRMVDMATEEANQRQSKVEFVRSGIGELAFTSGQFDLIAVVTVLQHITDDERCLKAIKNLARLVHNEGRIVICENLFFKCI